MKNGVIVLVNIIFIIFILDLIIYGMIINQKIKNGKTLAKITISPNPNTTFTSTPSPSLTLTPIPTSFPTKIPTFTSARSKSLSIDEMFIKYGNVYGVDPAVLEKIAGCESGYDPNQLTGDYAGLFQFGSLPWQEARARLGANPDLSLRFNAEESIRTAAHEIQIKGTSGWSDCD